MYHFSVACGLLNYCFLVIIQHNSIVYGASSPRLIVLVELDSVLGGDPVGAAPHEQHSRPQEL